MFTECVCERRKKERRINALTKMRLRKNALLFCFANIKLCLRLSIQRI